MASTRIVCLSDTHSLHDELVVPDGDILLHAGDFTRRGTPPEIERFAQFLARMPHAHKVIVAGNHDFLLQSDRDMASELLGDVTYLQDAGATIAGLRIWGSPWQPWFHDWAFNLPRGAQLADRWALIPDAIDVLITHGPPLGILDRTSRGAAVGCEELRTARERIRPKLHLFGHIHEAYGVSQEAAILSVNACNCDLGYRPVNPPIVIDWVAGKPVLVRD